MAQSGSGKKVANSLVAASAAAVLAVYAAGYERTRSAADKFDAQSTARQSGASDGRGRGPLPESSSDAAPALNSDNAPVRTASLDRIPVSPGISSGAPAPSASVAPASTQTPEPALEHKVDVVTNNPVEAAPAAPVVIAAITPLPAPAVAAPAAPATPPAAVPAPQWKDGTYTGWGTCRHGDIQAAVVIEGGRIKSASIAQCLTRYSCDVIGRLIPEVAQRQSAEVDYVSGATQSTYAFYYAVLEALGKAK